jgi:NAD(P) transhydrogenase subunit alpha
MIAGVLRETYPGERRVALVPAVLPSLAKAGLEALVEAGTGTAAGWPDPAYVEKGARIASSRAEVFSAAGVILQIRGYSANLEAGRGDLRLLRHGQVLIGQFDPLYALEAVKEIASTGATTFALEFLPRIARAQSMDVLSSMATVSGYKAVLMAANLLPKLFPMLMTAAGTVAPARVFVVGAGVAGLQAIATARRLGAAVEAFDIRPAVKEQIESLGAKFVELPLEVADAQDAAGYARTQEEAFYGRQREVMARVVAQSDVVITTALIPGQPAPLLITRKMVGSMAPGSVIVDLAAERGGNCELTRPNETVVEHGVTILGPVNVPSMVPHHASQLYARNISAFLQHVVKDGEIQVDTSDEIIRETLLTRGGKVVHSRIREALGLAPAAPRDERTPEWKRSPSR